MLPKKEWLTIAEVAAELNTTEKVIDNYLINDELRPAIKIPPTILNKCNIICDGEDTIPLKICEKTLHGIYYIHGYDLIRWIKSDNEVLYTDLRKSYIQLYDNVKNEYYNFVLHYKISKCEILIGSDDIKQVKSTFATSNEIGIQFQNSDTTPYLDQKHKYFCKELETAVSCWMELFNNGSYVEAKAPKKQIKSWIVNNRSKKYNLSNNAIERIVTLVNPRPEGGAPATPNKNHPSQ